MSLSLPSRRQEAWRWSDLSALPAIASSTITGPGLDPDAFWLGSGTRLLFVDGHYDAALSDPGSAIIERVDITSEHALGKMCQGEMFQGQGWTLRLNHLSHASQLIEILHVSTGSANHVPARLELAQDTQVSICETFVGDGWANRLTQIRLGAGSTLHRLVRLMQDSGFTSLRDEIEVGACAIMHTQVLGLGGAGTRIDAAIALTGTDAEAHYGGVLLAGQDQRHEVAAVARHCVPRGRSHQTWRAIAMDQATVSIAARVEIASDAQQTDAAQSLRGLLANQGAAINLKPELLIYADDVKAAHGATVGALDQEALHYLATRGIPPQEAQSLLMAAFVAQNWQGEARQAVQAGLDGPTAEWLERMV